MIITGFVVTLLLGLKPSSLEGFNHDTSSSPPGEHGYIVDSDEFHLTNSGHGDAEADKEKALEDVKALLKGEFIVKKKDTKLEEVPGVEADAESSVLSDLTTLDKKEESVKWLSGKYGDDFSSKYGDDIQKKTLRGSGPSISDLIVPLSKNAGEMTLSERADTCDALFDSFKDFYAALSEFAESNDHPAFEELLGSSQQHAKATFKKISNVIAHVRAADPTKPVADANALLEDSNGKKKDNDDGDGGVARRRAKGNQQQDQQKFKRGNTKHENNAHHRRGFSGSGTHGFHRSASPKLNRHFEFQDHILKGDHRKMKQKLSAMHSFSVLRGESQQHGSESQRGRRTQEENVPSSGPSFSPSSVPSFSPIPSSMPSFSSVPSSMPSTQAEGDREAKKKQCKLLAECANRMSNYDAFVYFYSDDIDPNTGEVDSSLIPFDEEDLFGFESDSVSKVAKIKAQSGEILEDFTDGDSFENVIADKCDGLLELFHRTIEVDGIPQWQGASVSQVCLAEGTTVYVKLEEVALTIFERPELSSPGGGDLVCAVSFLGFCLVETCETAFVLELNERANTFLEEAALKFVEAIYEVTREPLNCARELFFSKDRTEDPNYTAEPFVFGLEGKDPGEIAVYEGYDDLPTALNELEREYAAWIFPTGVSAAFPRNEHGQVLNNNKTAFETIPFPKLFEEYRSCTDTNFFESIKTDCAKELGSEPQCGSTNENGLNIGDWLGQCFGDIYLPQVLEECVTVFFEAVRVGMEYAFGEKPSTGFICGIKEAVVRDKNQSLPGSCCLDAPYQLDDADWGFPFECRPDDECKEKGPYFAGLSTEACDSTGGTWCAGATNCTDLKECVHDFIEIAERENRFSFAQYLRAAPQITDPLDFVFCGRTREYFGFDANFVNDDQICGDLEQFQLVRDFSFLDEFFDQGSENPGGGGGGGELPGGKIPPLQLTEPDEAQFDKAPFSNGQLWRATNFALTQAVGLFDFFLDLVVDIKCPCDPTCISENICKGILNIAAPILKGLFFIALKILEISEFTYGEVADVDNTGPLKSIEGISKVYENMEETGIWLAERFQQQLTNVISEADDIDLFLEQGFGLKPPASGNSNSRAAQDQTKHGYQTTSTIFDEVLCRPPEKLLPGHGCDGIDSNCCGCNGDKLANDVLNCYEDCDDAHSIDECDEDVYPPVITLNRVEEFCGSDTHVFPNTAKAVQCVKRHIIAEDDCYTLKPLSFTITGPITNPALCGSVYRVEITATEEHCEKSATAEFYLLVDASIAETNSVCEFSKGPDVPPSLDISAAINICSEKVIFTTIEDAKNCVETNTVATDDCRLLELDVSASVGMATPTSCATFEHLVTVTSSVNGCALSTTKTMNVFVDANVISPSCKFTQGPNLDPIIDMSLAVEFCEGNIFPTIEEAENCVFSNAKVDDAVNSCRPIVKRVSHAEVNRCEHKITITAQVFGCSEDSDSLKTVSHPVSVIIDNDAPMPWCDFGVSPFIASTGSGVLTDPQLTYGVSDNCGTPLNVKIEAFSNELEDLNSLKMVLLYEKALNPTDENREIGLYVASSICSTQSNGQCIKETGLENRRFYVARITATDQAGLVNTAECFVEVRSRNAKKLSNEDRPSQYFLVETYNYPTYIPTIILPDAEELNIFAPN